MWFLFISIQRVYSGVFLSCRNTPGLMVAALWLLMLQPAQAEIYKWQDQKGRTYYSDRAPPGLESQQDISERLPYLHEMQGLDEAFSIAPARPTSTRKTQPTRMKAGKRTDQVSQCSKYREQLERVQRRLRAGYGVSEGNKLREQRRELAEKQYRHCR